MIIYPQIKDNTWILPIQRGYKLACCDCGLVHAVDFKVVKGVVWFRVARDSDATEQIRTYHEYNPVLFQKIINLEYMCLN